MNAPRQRLEQGARALGLDLKDGDADRLLALVDLLARWNRVYNLTGVREPEAMVALHLLDSLALLPYLRGERILDLGTGAGFPGLPLAIVQPRREFVLLDGNGKKIRFVRQAVLELGLANARPVQARIESYPRGEKFATITARAFAPLPRLLDMVTPLLERPGVLLAPKGRGVREELTALPPEQGILRLHSLRIPFVDRERSLVEIQLLAPLSNSCAARTA